MSFPRRDSVGHDLSCCTFSGSRRPQSLWGPSTPPLTPALTSLCWTRLEKRLCSKRCASAEVRAIFISAKQDLLQSWCQTSSWNVLKRQTKWMVLQSFQSCCGYLVKGQITMRSLVFGKSDHYFMATLCFCLSLKMKSFFVCPLYHDTNRWWFDDWEFHLFYKEKKKCNKNRLSAFWNDLQWSSLSLHIQPCGLCYPKRSEVIRGAPHWTNTPGCTRSGFECRVKLVLRG